MKDDKHLFHDFLREKLCTGWLVEMRWYTHSILHLIWKEQKVEDIYSQQAMQKLQNTNLYSLRSTHHTKSD